MNRLQTIIDRKDTFTLLNAASGGPVSQDLTGQAIHFLNSSQKISSSNISVLIASLFEAISSACFSPQGWSGFSGLLASRNSQTA